MADSRLPVFDAFNDADNPDLLAAEARLAGQREVALAIVDDLAKEVGNRLEYQSVLADGVRSRLNRMIQSKLRTQLRDAGFVSLAVDEQRALVGGSAVGTDAPPSPLQDDVIDGIDHPVGFPPLEVQLGGLELPAPGLGFGGTQGQDGMLGPVTPPFGMLGPPQPEPIGPPAEVVPEPEPIPAPHPVPPCPPPAINLTCPPAVVNVSLAQFQGGVSVSLSQLAQQLLPYIPDGLGSNLMLALSQTGDSIVHIQQPGSQFSPLDLPTPDKVLLPKPPVEEEKKEKPT